MQPEVAGLSNFEEVGRGSFGTVYRATEDRFDREVAVKVIRGSGLGDESAARFERECRALGALSGHPNIVSVHDSGQTADGDFYLSMELLPGGSLADRVRASGPVDAETAVSWGVALAGALETAHRAGIVHRDVKPENVLFSAIGAPKLVDFGIARMRNAYETRTGSVSATLGHAAPETLAGAPATPSTDIYSLCSVLYFALAGAAPFETAGETSLAPLLSRIATAPPPPLADQGVPPELASVVEQGLGKEPADRFASAAELGTALQGSGRALGLAVLPLPIAPAAELAAAAAIGGVDPATTDPGTVQVARRPPPAAAAAEGGAPVRGRRRALLAAVIAAFIVAVLAAGAIAMTVGDDETSSASDPETTGTDGSDSRTDGDSDSTDGDDAGSTDPGGDTGSTTSIADSGTTDDPGSVVGGTDTGTSGSATAGSGTTTSGGPTDSGTTVPAANRAPSPSVANRSSNERSAVNVTISASDPDGDPVSLSISGLPTGLSASGGHITGTIAQNAATATTDWQAIQSRTFTVKVTATDNRGGSASRSFSWVVRDTHRTMPNYIDQYGCACDGLPDVARISKPAFLCAYDPAGNNERIYRQSVAPGATIAWGQSITYWYGKNDTSCDHVAKGW